jgi:hypothetical protein
MWLGFEIVKAYTLTNIRYIISAKANLTKQEILRI